MALYTRGSLERVKDAVDMVELVGARTELRRVGARHVGLCPFHDERTPSFSVNAEHGLFHCFGCGESGDAIGFVQKTEGLDFRDALEFLADRYGVELERERDDPAEEERHRRRERLGAAVERAAAFYARHLWESPEARRARDYLLGRGLSEQVLRDFRVGYAPSAWHRLVAAARREGFREEELVAAGLAQRSRDGRVYDRFRARIIFPLADARGRILGFGARAVREDQRPKYLNTSENELYHKGRQLFGIDRARGPAARAGRIMVVEGYTDVLALHQAGLCESVAIMGTALAEGQIRELARTAPRVFLALDADRSGQEAMLRASELLEGQGAELRVVALADGRDPADLLAQDGIDAFTGLLERSRLVPEFALEQLLAGADLATPEGRDRALDEARPLIARAPEGSARHSALVARLADALDLPVLDPKWARPPAPAGRPGARGPVPSRPPGRAERSPAPSLDAVARTERAFLAMCVSQPELGRELLERAGDGHFSFAPLRRVRDHLAEHLDDPLAELPADPAEAALVTEVAMLAEAEPSSEAVLRLGFLQLDLRRIDRELRRAEEARDFERQRALWTAREEAREELGQLMGQAV